MKLRNNKVFIIFLLVIVIVLWIMSSLNIQNPFSNKNAKTYKSATRDVTLNFVSEPIIFSTNNEGYVSYNLEGEGPCSLTVEETGGSLKIDIDQPKINYKTDQVLTVSVPATFIFTNLDVRTVSGAISFDTLNANDLKINTLSGKIKGNDLVSDNISMNSVSSDFNINSIHAFDSCNFKSTSGSLFAFFTVPVTLDFTSISGQADFEEKNVETKYEVKVNTISGNVKIDY